MLINFAAVCNIVNIPYFWTWFHINIHILTMGEIQFDMDQRYSFADYLTWDGDKRYELFNGHVMELLPSPTSKHQSVSGNLYGFYWNFLKDKKPCKVLYAPIDVRLPIKPDEITDDLIITVVQPDIIVVCDPEKLDEKGCIGAPDLVVEVLSPSTAKNDLKDKYLLYEQAGVREYWVVHPLDELLTVFKNNGDGKLTFDKIYTNDDQVKVGIFDGLIIDLKEVFDRK
jgi:Uma2 family endonuclease